MLPLTAALQLGVSIYELETVEADAAGGFVELGRARDPLSAMLDGISFELRPRYAMAENLELRRPILVWGRRDFLRYWDLWLSEREQYFTLEWRPPPNESR